MLRMLTLLMFAFSSIGVSQLQADVHESYADAYAASVKDGKPLVVLITAPAWCGPCRELDKKVKPMVKAGDFDSVHFYVLDYDDETKLANQLDTKKSVPVFLKWEDSKSKGTSLRGNQSKTKIIKFLGEKNDRNRTIRLKR
jgi:thiol-disulfide isomerase/thioredoxin